MSTPKFRAALAQSVAACSPRLILVAANAGAGKTTFAQLVAQRFERVVRVDCRDPAWMNAQALRAVRALTVEGNDAHLNLLVDNGEQLEEASPAFAILLDVVRSVGEQACVTLCTRSAVAPTLMSARFPHEIVYVTDDDLRLSTGEALRMVRALPEKLREDAVRRAGGNPLLLRLFAHAGEAQAPSLPTGAGINHPALVRAMTAQLLDRLSEREREALTWCSVGKHLRIAYLEAQFPAHVVKAVAQLPIVGTDAQNVWVHPLAAEALDVGASAAATILRALARRCEELGDCDRAAAYYVEAGDHEAAAAALSRQFNYLDQVLSNVAVASIRQIPGDVLMRHPQAWAMARAVITGSADRLRAEADAMSHALAGITDFETLSSCANAVANIYAHNNDFEAVERTINTYEELARALRPGQVDQEVCYSATLDFWRLTLRFYRGEALSVEEYRAVLGSRLAFSSVLNTAAFRGVEAYLLWLDDRRAEQRSRFEELLANASLQQEPFASALRMHAATWAWFYGDDELRETYLPRAAPASSVLRPFYFAFKGVVLEPRFHHGAGIREPLAAHRGVHDERRRGDLRHTADRCAYRRPAGVALRQSDRSARSGDEFLE